MSAMIVNMISVDFWTMRDCKRMMHSEIMDDVTRFKSGSTTISYASLSYLTICKRAPQVYWTNLSDRLLPFNAFMASSITPARAKNSRDMSPPVKHMLIIARYTVYWILLNSGIRPPGKSRKSWENLLGNRSSSMARTATSTLPTTMERRTSTHAMTKL